jgi:hypothetical protein
MSDFERELRGAKNLAQRQAQQQLEVEREAREKDQRIEREKREALERRRRAIEKYVMPVRLMVQRLLDDLGRQQWGNSNYGLAFTKYEKPPIVRERLAGWEVGRDRYGYLRKYGLFFRPSDGCHPSGRVGEHIYVWAPLNQTPGGKYKEFRSRESFGVSLLLEDDRPFFTIGNEYSCKIRRATTSDLNEQELRRLLVAEFLKGPDSRPTIHDCSAYSTGQTGYRREGDGYGG